MPESLRIDAAGPEHCEFDTDDLRDYRGEKQTFVVLPSASASWTDAPVLAGIRITPKLTVSISSKSRECFFRKGADLVRFLQRFVDQSKR